MARDEEENGMKQLHPVRAMLHCYFCGGRVVSTTGEEYRCETEGIRWDRVENLVTYSRARGEDLVQVRTQRDPESGKFVSS